MTKIKITNQMSEGFMTDELFKSNLEKTLDKCGLPTDFKYNANGRVAYFENLNIQTASRMKNFLYSMPGIGVISKEC